jgi:hypothetical protein
MGTPRLEVYKNCADAEPPVLVRAVRRSQVRLGAADYETDEQPAEFSSSLLCGMSDPRRTVTDRGDDS